MHQSSATVNWTRMIDFNFSAVVHPICGHTSAEVKSNAQNRCRAHQSGTFLIIQTNCKSNRSHLETAAHFVQIQWCDYYNTC